MRFFKIRFSLKRFAIVYILGIILIIFLVAFYYQGYMLMPSPTTSKGYEFLIKDLPSVKYQPVLAWSNFNGWRYAEAVEVRFVLYSNGLLIYQAKDPMRGRYVHNTYNSVTLKKAEMRTFLKKTVKSDFYRLYDRYYTSSGTDQQWNVFYAWDGGKLIKRVDVYSWKEERIPRVLLRLFKKLSEYSHSKATIWMPKKLGVQLRDRGTRKLSVPKWPKTWPDINHPQTKKRRKFLDEYRDYVYIDSIHLGQLQKMYRTMISMNNRIYYCYFSYAFPNESMWYDIDTYRKLKQHLGKNNVFLEKGH